MSDKDLERPGKGWVTKRELSNVLDITPRCFDHDYRRYVEPDGQKKIGQTLWFKARSFLDRWKAAGGGVKAPAGADGELDPLMAGADSPWLEAYRKQRALQEEIKLEQMRGNTVAVAEIEPALLNLGGMLRRCAEALQRRYGNDAGQMVNEVIDQWQNGVEAVLTNERSDKPDPASV